jgi:hypothetical protein
MISIAPAASAAKMVGSMAGSGDGRNGILGRPCGRVVSFEGSMMRGTRREGSQPAAPNWGPCAGQRAARLCSTWTNKVLRVAGRGGHLGVLLTWCVRENTEPAWWAGELSKQQWGNPEAECPSQRAACG